VERLTGVAELLDGPLDDGEAVVANLRDLARLNRLTGGVRISVAAIRALAGDRLPGSILDVGAGGADIPVALLAAARRDGVSLEVTAMDSRREVLEAARLARPGIDRLDGLALGLADGRALPYPDASFDVGHASLVLHHLEPVDAIAFLSELRRVARVGIVVNDLVRGRLAWLGAWLLVHSVATARFTRNDGPLSVRRAYSRAELDDLLRSAGIRPVRTVVGFAGHRVAIAAR
jgi:ubiquinone/menaquinone biosynthesis C-methylase UbiE